ncbi:MAG: hypothetical protein ACYC1P_13045 [Gaiellaceae bacterium]
MVEDEGRVAEIELLFDAKGWRLRLEEVEGRWEASFRLRDFGGVAQTAWGFDTRVSAAEAAWAKYLREPWLGGGAVANDERVVGSAS